MSVFANAGTSMHASRIARRRERAATSDGVFMAVFAAFVGVRVWNLTHQSLWFDEAYTVHLVTSSSWHQFWARFGGFTTSEHLQPLYYVLMFVWSRVAGTSDFALRLPSTLFSAGSVLALWAAVRGQHGAWVANIAAAALALSSFSVYYAQEARPYAMLQMLSFLLLGAWLAQRRDRWTRPVTRGDLWLGLVCVLCVLASPFTALLAACVAATELAARRDLRSWWGRWKMPAVLCCAVGVAYWRIAVGTFPKIVAKDITPLKQPLWMNAAYVVRGLAFGATIPPSTGALRGAGRMHALLSCWPALLAACVVLALLGIAAAKLLAQTRVEDPLRILALAAVAYTAALFGIFGEMGRLNVLPRHASPLFALAFLIFALLGATAPLGWSRADAGTWALRAGAVGWALVNIWSIANYWRDPAFAKDDYRAMAAMLRQQPMPTVMAGGQALLLNRYGYPVVDANLSTGPQLLAILAAHTAGGVPVRIVMNQYRSSHWHQDADLVRYLSPGYACAEQPTLRSFDVYICQPLASHAQAISNEPPGGIAAKLASLAAPAER